MALPVTVLANPEKAKRSPKQIAAAKRNIKKAQAARKAAAKPTKAPTAPKAKASPKAKPKKAKPKGDSMATKAKAKRSPAQIAAAKKNIKKAQAARKAGATKKGASPRKTGGKAKSNPGEETRTGAAMQMGLGSGVGGLAVAATEYVAAGTEVLATPGRRAALSFGLGVAAGLGGVAMPSMAAFFGSVAGCYIGNASVNATKALVSGGSTGDPAPTAPTGGAAQTMEGVELRRLVRPGRRQLAEGQRVKGVVLNANELRGVVMSSR